MGREHEEPQHLRIVDGVDLPDGLEVSKGLGHLVVIDVQEGIVHPVMDERLSVCALGLGDFILMVREDQILAAGVDVDGISKIPLAHDGALDVPAGTALAPGGIPVGLPFLLRFPQDEV